MFNGLFSSSIVVFSVSVVVSVVLCCVLVESWCSGWCRKGVKLKFLMCDF